MIVDGQSLEKAVLPPTDRELIAELRSRGYKVFPEQRFRIYASATTISYLELGRMHDADERKQMLYRIHRRMAADVGIALFEAGACVRTGTDGPMGKEFRAQVGVVLPNDFDFEAEMWGVRS